MYTIYRRRHTLRLYIVPILYIVSYLLGNRKKNVSAIKPPIQPPPIELNGSRNFFIKLLKNKFSPKSYFFLNGKRFTFFGFPNSNILSLFYVCNHINHIKCQPTRLIKCRLKIHEE